MEYFPAPLENLVEQFARLPGIGGPSPPSGWPFMCSACPRSEARDFADAIVDAKRSVTLCPVCQNLTAGGLCPICASPKRDDTTICVVADPRDVLAIERSREYQGRYHVLHGVLSPMNHVGPDDLQIKSLLDRVGPGRHVRRSSWPPTLTPRGRPRPCTWPGSLKPFGVKVTRLAYGIPVGGHLEFADDATLMRALEGQAGAVKRVCLRRAGRPAAAVPFPAAASNRQPEQLSLFAMDTYMTLAAYGRQGLGGPGRLRSRSSTAWTGPSPGPGRQAKSPA